LRRGIAKLVKALDFDSSIPRFESLFPCHSFLPEAVDASSAPAGKTKMAPPSADHSTKYSATRLPLVIYQKFIAYYLWDSQWLTKT
jgi:hypothetical protein